MSPSIVTTPKRWFVRGSMVGVLVSGSLNAASYFFRSDRWGNLLGTTPRNRESLGFPCELWESGNTYGGLFVDIWGLAANALFTVIIAVVCGLVTLAYRERLNRLVEELERSVVVQPRGGVQVSLRGLLLATGLAAVLATAARYALAGRPEVLGFIYLLGPWILVVIAFVPLGLSWQQRVYILIPMTLLLMSAAVVIGMTLKPSVEFDKVLLGFFICWTPQCALAAIALTVALITWHVRSVKQR
jgi:hypothetical protein